MANRSGAKLGAEFACHPGWWTGMIGAMADGNPAREQFDHAPRVNLNGKRFDDTCL
jgi:hypothetical protein